MKDEKEFLPGTQKGKPVPQPTERPTGALPHPLAAEDRHRILTSLLEEGPEAEPAPFLIT